jgi:hypothetical protein
MADFRYVICDVFTDRPLAGNQGAEIGRPDGITRIEVGGAAGVVARGEFRLDV